jgi:hypothetical protein
MAVDLVPIFWNRFIDYQELSKYRGLRAWKDKFYFTLLDNALGREYFFINLASLVFSKNFDVQAVFLSSNIRKTDAVDKNKARRRADYHFRNQNAVDETLLAYFQKILTLCKSRGISILTLQVPMSKHYIQFASKYIKDEELKRIVFKNPGLNSLIYRNLNFLYAYADEDSFFLDDGDHLNVNGRKAFSAILAYEIRKALQKK